MKGTELNERIRNMADNESIILPKYFYDYKDICQIVGCSNPGAYEILRKLNNELEEKGYNIIKNKVPVAYFKERYYLEGKGPAEDPEDKAEKKRRR